MIKLKHGAHDINEECRRDSEMRDAIRQIDVTFGGKDSSSVTRRIT
jgi:hypothetical protein